MTVYLASNTRLFTASSKFICLINAHHHVITPISLFLRDYNMKFATYMNYKHYHNNFYYYHAFNNIVIPLYHNII